jgi:hypothetical protein
MIHARLELVRDRIQNPNGNIPIVVSKIAMKPTIQRMDMPALVANHDGESFPNNHKMIMPETIRKRNR